VVFYRNIRTGRHRVSALDARLGFVTRYRHPVSSSQHLGRTEEIMRDLCTDFECDLAEFNGEAGHVHLLVNFPPEVALSRLVNSLKGVSSRRLRPGIPGTAAAALLEGEPAAVLFRWVRRRRTHHGLAPVHRTAGQACLISAGVRPPSPPA
jgi:putative transposase